MKKTLVIMGASGYIGSHLLRAVKKTHRVKLFAGDIRDRKAVERAVKKGDTVVNLVGTTTIPQDAQRHFDVNVTGQEVVASVCALKGARVVYLSTVHVYKSGKRLSRESDPTLPEDAYSFSKKLGEEVYGFYARTAGLSAVVCRLGSVYGPNHRKGVVWAMAQSLRTRGVIEVPKQRVVRDLVHIDDVVRGIQRALAYPKKGFSLFNITGGAAVELAVLARLIAGRHVVRVDKRAHPAIISVSIAKAKKELGFVPRMRLAEGLQGTLTSYTI